MNQSQLKSLPSVSEVLLEINQECTYDHRIISLWINQFLSKYRMKAKNGKLDLNREEIIKVININTLRSLFHIHTKLSALVDDIKVGNLRLVFLKICDSLY